MPESRIGLVVANDTKRKAGDSRMKQATPVIRAKVAKLNKVKRLIKRLEAVESTLSASVKDYIGEPQALVFNDEKLAILTKVNRTSVDSQKLKTEFAEVYANVCKTTVYEVLNLC